MSEDQTVDSIACRIWVAGEKPKARWLRPRPVENFTIAYDKSESVGILRMDGETTRASVDITAK
jgi:hypothetical protein